MTQKTARYQLVIRAMRRSDAAAITGMMTGLQAFHGDKSVTTATHFVQHCCGSKKLADAWIAFVGSIPAGFAVTGDWMNFVRAKPTRTLHLLYVEELFRGRGVGAALVTAIAKEGIKKGILRLDTTAALTNRQANAFYKALGFDFIKHKARRYGIDGKALKRLAEQK